MQQETLDTILEHLSHVNADIEAAAIISPEGVSLFSSLPQHLSGQRIGTIMATINYCGRFALQGACYGNLKHILLKLISGYILLTPLSANRSAVVIFKAETPLDSIVGDVPQLVTRLAA